MIVASLVVTIMGLLVVIVGVASECNELSRRNAELTERLRRIHEELIERAFDDTRR